MTGSEYDLDFFREEEFTRQQCAKCGRFFWARTEMELCGESPCIEYSFIGNPPTREKHTLHETREKYLSFFERNGHTRVNRYPITARWRDDVFFTQASIYGFQPWVISGAVEPPANPLTISQTCVRFNDIDNVGRTGSHLTMFEMMAHHVFNKKDNFIYFKDRTTELCDRLLREDFGIPQERISYIEADWKGGGNSGPCLEVMVDGVELATLVFMMYAESGGQKTPLDMQVVDTGYGLERLAWLSQGTSSAYEAVFGPPLDKLKQLSGIKPDSSILSEFSKVAGLLNIDNPGSLAELRKQVAGRLDLSIEQLEAETKPMENIYVVCDHTRALAFMLNDGIVPSNVKAGYFGRMLVRRATRAMSSLGVELPLVEVVASHLDYFKEEFPELKENGPGILELVEVESRKYEETLKKGSALVSRLETRLGEEGKKIGPEQLVDLYDSHGLNPEVVKEFATHDFDIPDDFYQAVAARHEEPEAEVAKTEEKRPDVPPTVLGYYDDPYIHDFKAKVLKVIGKDIILDKTYFYAEGGGQENDTGTMEGHKITDVQSIGNVIVHTLETDNHGITEGQEVSCSLNWSRRRQLMRHHTATHLINAAAREVLGNHIWQTGAHKSEDMARLDITHYAAPTPEQFHDIEEKANAHVIADIPVDSYVMNRTEAEKEFGMRLYQGGAVPGKDLRIINVRGVDVEACGGLHCARTTEIGPIKLLRFRRIQDGVLRLEFIAGRPLYEWMKAHHKTVSDVSDILGVDHERIPETVENIHKEWKEYSRTQKKDEKKGANELLRHAIETAEEVGGIRFIELVIEGSMDIAVIVSRLLSKENNIFAVIGSSQDPTKVLFTTSSNLLNCGTIAKSVASEFGTGGGGRKDFAQIGIPNADKETMARLRKRALEIAKESVSN